MPRPQVAMLALAALAASLAVIYPPPSAPAGTGTRKESVVEGYGSLPISFEPNVGQAPGHFDFVARGQGFGMAIDAAGATLSLGTKNSQDLVRMDFVGANASASPRALESLPGKVNYFVGNDPTKWRSAVPTFGRIAYTGVLPGIDVTYYGTMAGTLEYDLVLAPGADPDDIRVAFSGASNIALRGGSLVIATAGGTVTQPAPVIYQTIADRRVPVAGRFLLVGHEVGFEVGAYDHDHPLVIDPTLAYSTYLGGTKLEEGHEITVDSSGQAYVTGVTYSTNFPTRSPFGPSSVLQGSNGQGAGGTHGADAFISKLNATGSGLVYSTYLGGSGDDFGTGIAVDSAAQVYVTGYTDSLNFPTRSPFQASNAQGPSAGAAIPNANDAFVTKLDANGSALVYSTYLGGSGADQGGGISIDRARQAYVTGWTASTDFPTEAALQGSNRGGYDAFVTKFDDTGSALVYSTYFGGTGHDNAYGIAVEPTGVAYVTGYTSSTNFPTQTPFQASKAGPYNAFVTKLDDKGAALVYSTYLGGNGSDIAYGIAVDDSGAAFVTGHTTSTNFPVSQAPFQRDNAGSIDGFVTKLAVSGSALEYSTYLGGTDADYARGIAINDAGEAFVTGDTGSANFPTKDPIQASKVFDAFVSRLDATGSTLGFSTYLGGSGGDLGYGIAVDEKSAAYITGVTSSANFPTVAPPLQATNAGAGDAFVTKLAPSFVLTVTKAGTGFGKVTSGEVGINCGEDCSEAYDEGTLVTLTATANPGSSFSGWTGGCSGASTCMLTMNAAQTATATFAPLKDMGLAVTKAGTGSGTVTSSPAGINCGADCNEVYAGGTVVTLTATADSGSSFVGWAGDCSGASTCTLTMSANRAATATFDTPRTLALTVTKAGTGSGTVTSSPVGISCGSDCAESYPAGQLVTLTATPDSGSSFSGWSGDCSGTSTCTLTMSAARAATATFNPAAPGVTCGRQPVTIQVTAPNQMTFGTAGPDVIVGTSGIDTIKGLGGNDIVCGNDGNDTLYGNAGNDTLYGNGGNDTLIGGNYLNQFNDDPGGNDFLYGGDGKDIFYAGGGDDTLYGNDGNDILMGWHGNNTLYGNAGNDFLEGNTGDDYLYGGGGNDTFQAFEGDDHLYGDAGDDNLYAGDGKDTLDGGPGKDNLKGGPNTDACNGGADHDTGVHCEPFTQ